MINFNPKRFRQDELDALPDRLVGPREAASVARRSSLRQFKRLLNAGIFDLDKHAKKWAPLAIWIAADNALPTADNVDHTEVYFIECAGYIKIGYSTSALSRMADLQSATPHKLNFLGIIKGSPRDEARFHSYFQDSRHIGEWFKTTPTLLAYIDWLLAQK